MAIPHYEILRLIVTVSYPEKRAIGSSDFLLTAFDLIDSHICQLADCRYEQKVSANAHGVKRKQVVAVKTQCCCFPNPFRCIFAER